MVGGKRYLSRFPARIAAQPVDDAPIGDCRQPGAKGPTWI